METILTLDNGKNKISFKVSGVEDLKKLKSDLIEFVELDVNIYTEPAKQEPEELEVFRTNYIAYSDSFGARFEMQNKKGEILKLSLFFKHTQMLFIWNTIKEKGATIGDLKRLEKEGYLKFE